LPKISVVIVSYRGRNLLEACLRSVDAHGLRGDMEVIVVDNASDDGTVRELAPCFPTVRWVENAENVGFATAANQAAALASGEYLLILNPDARLVADGLTRLLDFIEKHPEVGVVGPRLLISDGRPYVSITPFPTIASVLLYETRLNRLFKRLSFVHPYAWRLQRAEPFPVDAVEGSCFLVHRRVWNAVGGFDTRYFFGFEDMDFAWRVRQAGWEIWFHPFPVAVHHHSGSTGGKRQGVLVLVSVGLGQLYFLREHKRVAYSILRLPLLVIFTTKWFICFLLCRTEPKVAFREAVKALMALRLPWITADDLRRWR